MDAGTQKTIPEIHVIHKTRYSPYGNDTVKTNANGEFEMKMNDIGMLYAQDLDGEKNGYYKADSLKLSQSLFKQTEKGSGNWFQGVYEKNNTNFYLKQVMMMPMYGIRPAEYKDIKE